MLKYRVTRPDLPKVEEWMPLISQAYATRCFSNFGPISRLLERKLQDRYGAAESVCVLSANATSALASCLIAANVQGRVAVPAFTFPASLSAVNMARTEPFIIDVDPDHWTISLSALCDALENDDVAAVMLVAPFGIRQDFSEHIAISHRYGVPVVIDNAAGLGVERVPVELSGHVCEVFSMHATKPFAIGEGGVIFAGKWYESALRAAANFALPLGSEPSGPHWGLNGKMSEIHAAIGLAQYEGFAARLSRRRAFAANYVDALAPMSLLRFPRNLDAAPWQVFPVLLPNSLAATALVARAAKEGVEVRRYYRPSLSEWPKLRFVRPCPVAMMLADRMCCLPVYSDATEAEIGEILDIVVRSLRDSIEETKCLAC